MQEIKTIQIHATQNCNLTCKHCYSNSAPGKKSNLNISELKSFLEIAKSNGFNNLSFSGGEPFLYREFGEILSYSKELEFQNTVASKWNATQFKNKSESVEIY